ncbi:MAG: YdcH family protein [Proteobacteria bacterium]|nr:YdcH family protein [Pseudomonadota bacterium]
MFESHSRDELDSLLKSNVEFRQLYHRHRELDKQVMDAELGVLPLDDTTLAQMKREKLHAKDRLTHLFENRPTH